MSGADTRKLWFFSILALVAIGGPVLWQGVSYIGKHEGDTLHLVDILTRLAEGHAIHRDLMTPIGIMAFAPMHWMGAGGLGLGIGQSFLAAQALMAALLLPAAVWVGHSRLGTAVGALFVVVIVVFCVALVHGEGQVEPSISMHYNRWAWAAAFCALMVAMVAPSYRVAPRLDGLVIGTTLAFLALSKVTYFVAFAPAVALALLLRRDWSALVWAAATGIVAALAVTLWQGLSYWPAYVADLLAVSGSHIRPRPGETLPYMLSMPAHIGTTLAGFAAVILLRQAGRMQAGLTLLIALPGFFYVTYQNYGNDPQWIVLLPFLLLALWPAEGARNVAGWDLRLGAAVLTSACVALAAPSFLNLAYSPFRHLAIQAAHTTPLIPGHGDLRTGEQRAYGVMTQRAVAVEGASFARFSEQAAIEPAPVLLGVELPHCRHERGLKGVVEGYAQDLQEAGFAGSGIYFADVFNSIWLFGDFRPLKGGAPWYYGALPGWEDADYLAVPMCPSSSKGRRASLAEFEARGIALREVWRNETLILLERDPHGGTVAALQSPQPGSAAIAR